MESDVKNIRLAAQGNRRIDWADRDMPVLGRIRRRFDEEKPFAGVRIAACLHVTAETANLLRTLREGGAEVTLCASNPLSTQDEVAAALARDYGVGVFACRGASKQQYYAHMHSALAIGPNLTFDDGADLVSTILTDRKELAPKIVASMEETTSGVARLRSMRRGGLLSFPVFAVNDADTKHLFDNRYGTGQSTVEGILRSTRMLIAGRTVVVAGFGMCGRGIASRIRGLGAKVIITEIDPIKAIEATMDGYDVMTMSDAAPRGDLFITVSGNADVLRGEHFRAMKSGAFIANSGHFNIEINIDELSDLAADIHRDVNHGVDEFLLEDGRSIFLLGEGRLINLAAAEGHPACVMDMSFSLHALTAEYALKNADRLKPRIYAVPKDIDRRVATLKLQTMSIRIDELSANQKHYMASWEQGT